MVSKKMQVMTVAVLGDMRDQRVISAEGYVIFEDEFLCEICFFEEATPEDGAMKTRLFFLEKDVMMHRVGDAVFAQSFVTRATEEGEYTTPLGSLKTKAHTHSISQTGDAQAGKIEIKYDLWIENEKSGTFFIEIVYK